MVLLLSSSVGVLAVHVEVVDRVGRESTVGLEGWHEGISGIRSSICSTVAIGAVRATLVGVPLLSLGSFCVSVPVVVVVGLIGLALLVHLEGTKMRALMLACLLLITRSLAGMSRSRIPSVAGLLLGRSSL